MRITKLSLTNFRSFQDTQVIEFAPLTLLFGPNSVGKSSVLMSLFYIHHILKEGDCNPLRLEALGNKYVGGFKGLVHGRDTSKTIGIRIDYNKGKEIGVSYNDFRDLIEADDLDEEIEWLYQLPDAAGTVTDVGIEFTIDWGAYLNDAYVSSCKIFLNNIEFAHMTSQSDGQQSFIEAINYLHPILVGDEHDEWLEQCFDSGGAIHTSNASRAFSIKGHDVPQEAFDDEDGDGDSDDYDPNEWPDGIPSVGDHTYASMFHELINQSRISESELAQDHFSFSNSVVFVHVPIAFENLNGSLPLLGRSLTTTLDSGNKFQRALVHELLSDAIVPAFDNLFGLLEDSLCIGPLRHVPDASYQPSKKPRQADWYDGRACWDSLARHDYSLPLQVNHWLAGENKLDLGYKLVFKATSTDIGFIEPLEDSKSLEMILKLIDVYGRAGEQERNAGTPFNDLLPPMGEENLKEHFEKLLAEEKGDQTSHTIAGGGKEMGRELTLWDIKNNIEVSASDIGVGVSQLLPLIVAGLMTERGLVAVEQPELHVHPRVQVAIGDFLTQLKIGFGFLVETHSEHLILRILKRIRQTTDKELPADLQSVYNTDVSIVYLESSENGVRARRIHIDEDGEFREFWPQGFFSERREELM